MKQYDPDADGRKVSEEEANAIADAEEDFPTDAPDAEKAPQLKKINGSPKKGKKDGIDRAMEILDEYMEGVEPINPNVRNYEE